MTSHGSGSSRGTRGAQERVGQMSSRKTDNGSEADLPRFSPEAAAQFADEVENFREIARLLKPSTGERPEIPGLEIAGVSRPLKDALIGGDHLVYLDFKRRFDLPTRIANARRSGRQEVAERLASLRERSGILLADAAGHRITDALVTAMLHQAFLLGTYYELDINGEITTRLFQHLKQRFFESTGIRKFVTMLYGEVWSDGAFRFVSAGHPLPVVYSRRYERLVHISRECATVYTPLGMLPPEQEVDAPPDEVYRVPGRGFRVNEIRLMGERDVMILYTDGFAEQGDGEFFRSALERCLRAHQDENAGTIAAALDAELDRWGPQEDDITFVVVRRT